MNTIALQQNTIKQLQRLAAQRQLYSSAKKVFATQVWLSGPLAVALAFLGIYMPSARGYIGLWTILLVLVDSFWLTPWQKALRDRAARAQELFDCDVLNLPWNTLKAGERLDPELVKEQSDQYGLWAHKMPPLENWYSVNGSDLPLPIARVACQRSNCWWDSEQRKRYALIVVVSVTALLVTVIWVALVKQSTIEDLLIRALVPMVPLFLLGFRQYSEQKDAAARMDKLKEHAGKLWLDALSGQPPEEAILAARNLQDEIFESRRRSPLVFDFVFRRLQPTLEGQMNYGAEELFQEARYKLRAAGNGS